MGLSCKTKSSVAVCNSTQDPNRNNEGILESFKFRDLEAATGFFARENYIGKASHGHMYKGVLQDGRVVTVKRPGATPGARHFLEDVGAFNNEIQILSKLFSRRLVNLLGCSQDGRVKPILVLEHMEKGSLHENLQSDTELSLSWPLRVKLALDVAKAIRALHASSPSIVHRNIRSTNVFVDRDGSARLGDFCLAKSMQQEIIDPPRRSNLISIPEVLTATAEGYNANRMSMAVEDFDSEFNYDSSTEPTRVSPKTDVFSFGVILLELMSGRSAASLSDWALDMTPLRSLLDWALPLIKHGHSMAICDPRITPPPDNAAVRHMASVAARCVRSSSSRRPSMEDVVQCLSKASKLVPEPMWSSPTSSANYTSTEVTPSRDKIPLVPQNTSRRDRSIPNVDNAITPAQPSRQLQLPRSSMWASGFFNLKKKRTFVFRLSRFLARKFRVGHRRSYDKLVPAHYSAEDEEVQDSRRHRKRYPKSGAVKGAKVSDEDIRDRSIVMPPRLSYSKSAVSSASRHHSGKKFVRL
ncbi:serine/threonine-protein kinase-like protein At3g51990 [Physcomitrium patens]|uniref:Protein kinase domain-containing protein n=1 Tax=Physcomitrium patens TaxID=3218 RepID=A0A2K1KGU4_PHYPA|nr:serine/threonine-protein kinase-like protein At3g51990 [Physcomitrium patens]XP_024378130.1 serine/threonine-protein kinase-like protein At3g51990 [Physcomitrium patens]XP_024378131.1 serine/threonine-protein kinase-like protein At3g51990 [Physcomitrium patens]XP_024378133.1 serine/threonine-protein kinase-like protein At3g51990 [Physcomitrium patens]XP_024378134.1 serine/threonine-protein kinase-like protein At3g51990 [Physcomitrium patens]XP_024378135.1 serine/threonine-protein kinase-lik|eukprot:XP_024378129.1 serine/threonine-protein kinase-like protein At3g51990 [Physcomitrella patens]